MEYIQYSNITNKSKEFGNLLDNKGPSEGFEPSSSGFRIL